jgi:triosephosphate isomerase
MNTDLASAVELAEDVAAGCEALARECDIVLYPPFPYLQAVGRALGNRGLYLGAQDVYCETSGAYTGEVSPAMLVDLGVSYVLAGHSERRHIIGEDDELVSRKVRTSLAAELNVVLCVGETLGQREAQRTEAVVLEQLARGLEAVPARRLRQVVIAYEPVWAIGTGRTARAEDAQVVHALIRRALAEAYDDRLAGAVRIQYGGSLKARLAPEIFARPDVDGGLVGGASLTAPLPSSCTARAWTVLFMPLPSADQDDPSQRAMRSMPPALWKPPPA